MTQSFDEWRLEQDRIRNDYDAENAWYAGAQSRQVEIDELKATIVKYEAGLRKNKANKHKILAKNIELQKRVDEALRHMVDHGGYDYLTHVINILKGKEND